MSDTCHFFVHLASTSLAVLREFPTMWPCGNSPPWGGERWVTVHDGLKCGPSRAQHTAEAWPEEGDRDGEGSGDSVT